MSPDKASVIAVMAAILESKRREVAKNDFILDVGRALLLYREAERQVRASGPTSKPLKPQVEACSHCACRVCETEMKRREDAGE